MIADDTWDVFSTLDGYGSCAEILTSGTDPHALDEWNVRTMRTPVFVISGLTGTSPILAGAGDFDLELLESRTLDGRTQLLVYRPTVR